jgi:GT2 family glycosyltransferase
MKLSVIIVSYKCKDVLDVTLEAVYASNVNFDYEVIILDNDSNDGTVEMVKEKYLSQPEIAARTQFIENRANLGFPKANNIGMKKAKGEYILLLNPDTKVDVDNFQVMMDFMESRPDVGIATCKLMLASGGIDPASRRSEPEPKIAFYRLSGLQYLFPKKFGAYNVLNSNLDEESELDACVGAYMFMSRACYEKTGGFDERFYMYGEDLDLCKQARELGFKVWYYPKTTCLHFKGQSSKRAPQLALYAFHEAMWIYYDKHYRKKYNFLMDALVYIGVWGRYYWKSFRNLLRPKNERYVSM